MTPLEVSQKYNYGYSSVCKWIHDGELPAVIVTRNGASSYELDDFYVEEFMKRHKKSRRPKRRTTTRSKDNYKKINKGSMAKLERKVSKDEHDEPVKESNLTLALRYLTLFSEECYDTYTLTPKQYLRVMRVVKLLEDIKLKER